MRRLLQTWRDGAIKPTAVAAVAPKPREVTGWIIRPAAERTDREQADLARVLERCDSLRTVDELVSDFAGMLRQRQGSPDEAFQILSKLSQDTNRKLRDVATVLVAKASQ